MIVFLHYTSLVVVQCPQQRRFIPIVLGYRAGERIYRRRVLEIQLGDEVIRHRWFVQVAEVVEGVSWKELVLSPMKTMDVGINSVGSDQADAFIATKFFGYYRNTFCSRRTHSPFYSGS